MKVSNPSAFLERLSGAPLRAITRLSGSELAERLKIRKPAERAIYDGVRAGALAIASARKALAGPPKRLDPSKGSGMFDPRPTEEQALVRDSMKRFADEVLRPAGRPADDAAGATEGVLAQVQALGLAALVVPESLGGAATERSTVTGALVAEELARGDMGVAVAALAPIGVVNAIVEWGTAEQQARLVPPFVGDKFVPTAIALLEPRPLFDPMRPRTGAVKHPDGGWALWGEKALVPLAAQAAFFLVVADIKGAGPRLFVVDRSTPGVTVVPDPAMGVRGAALGRIKLEGARVGEDALLGGPAPEEPFDLGVLVDRARIAWCAMGVGTAQAVLDYVIPYVNSRIAFGEPVSNRQAVAFLVADMALEIEGMRLMVHRAAALADRGKPFEQATTAARIQCAAKGAKIGSDGVQLLGGHGFVKEHPVERWYRDLRAVGILEGALLA
jgi:alkylation response protein AidB-like acyl-CoA dehydrogenase